MRSIIFAIRDVVVCGILAGGIVAFVLGYWPVGIVLGVVGIWQVVRVMRGRPSIIGIDQRWSDREGRANLRR